MMIHIATTSNLPCGILTLTLFLKIEFKSFKSVKVNSFNGKYLTTTAAAIITESEAQIEVKEVYRNYL